MAVDLRLKGECKMCRYWQEYPTNPMVGECPVLAIMLFPQSPNLDTVDGVLQVKVAIVADPYSYPPSEVIAVRTVEDFGCIHFDPRKGA